MVEKNFIPKWDVFESLRHVVRIFHGVHKSYRRAAIVELSAMFYDRIEQCERAGYAPEAPLLLKERMDKRIHHMIDTWKWAKMFVDKANADADASSEADVIRRSSFRRQPLPGQKKTIDIFWKYAVLENFEYFESSLAELPLDQRRSVWILYNEVMEKLINEGDELIESDDYCEAEKDVLREKRSMLVYGWWKLYFFLRETEAHRAKVLKEIRGNKATEESCPYAQAGVLSEPVVYMDQFDAYIEEYNQRNASLTPVAEYEDEDGVDQACTALDNLTTGESSSASKPVPQPPQELSDVFEEDLYDYRALLLDEENDEEYDSDEINWL